MSPVEDQPRPVVDRAATQTRRQEIIAAVFLVLAAIPAIILVFAPEALTAAQVSGITVFLGVLMSASLVIFGRQDLTAALKVEVEVTPMISPRDDEGGPLVPVALDGLDD